MFLSVSPWVLEVVSIPQGSIKGQNAPIAQGTHEKVSIPQGSIKGCEIYADSDTLDAVSIPQGSIKGRRTATGDARLRSFQSHKVRLKDVYERFGWTRDAPVSIPQGSIKGWRLDTHTPATRVSIPQGSIKGQFSVPNPRRKDMFQSHKVRLKDESNANSPERKAVSIPQGSIKGPSWGRWRCLSRCFNPTRFD